MAVAKTAYLLAYNSILTGAWAVILYRVVRCYAAKETQPQMFEQVKRPLAWAQTAALLEILHSALGVVRSPVFTTLVQVSSRIWVLWGLIWLAPEATSTGSLGLGKLGSFMPQLDISTLLLAWSVTEVLRYSFFAVKEIAKPPYAQLWLRYSAFIPLYPLGVASELTMAYLALPVIKAKQPFSFHLPNKLNFGFDYYTLCWAFIAAYLPGLPFMYTHMLHQRRKLLGGAVKGKTL